MRILRWALLLLYIALIVGLFASGLATGANEDRTALCVVLGVTIAADALFILGAGHKDLFRPIRRRRLVLPVAAAAFMLAVLLVSLTFALADLFRIPPHGDSDWAFWPFIGASWLFWGVLLYAYTRKLSRYQAIYRLAKLVFAGSLAELLAAAPAHIIVSRRSGCFVGLVTGISVIAGLYVMIWSFGPAIFLLFLQEARRRERRNMPPATTAVPKSRARLQYRLRTLLLVMLGTNIVCALLKDFWLGWLSAAIIALVILALALVLFTGVRWLLAPASLGAVVAVAWAFRGEWSTLAILTVPLVILAVLQLRLFLRRPPIDPPPA
jgi:hypothetical protein